MALVPPRRHGRGLGLGAAVRLEGALLLGDMPLEFRLEFLDDALGGHRRGDRPDADRAPDHLVADLEDDAEIRGGPASRLEAAEDLVQPPRALAAWRALSARLVVVEAQDV